jgi:predicted GH43/DUF377 family glycosyl hydrolase
MNYIQETQTEEGVDFVILKDGRVLGIDADYVMLYASLDDFYNATSQTKPTINLKD